MFKFFKNFQTRLSSQFAILTSLLIAIIVLFLASYSINFMNNFSKVYTSDSKNVNTAVSAIVMQLMGDYLERGDYNQIKKVTQSMINTNLIANLRITDKATHNVLYESNEQAVVTKPIEQKIVDKTSRKNATTVYYVTAATVDGTKLIRVGFYSEPVVKIYLDILMENMGAMVVIFIFIGFFLANLIANILIKPINTLILSLKKAKGDFSHRLEATNYLEINRLIESYNEMAASLEKLYQSMEQLVKERTSELEQAYTELKNTQAMMVHSEKMKSLGELVAGITHEINNPINFIYGNIMILDNYQKDLLALIDKYALQESSMNPDAVKEINDFKQTIDLDFLKDDIADLIRSCLEGVERTKNIILDLKNFSRMDEMVFSECNIPKEIDTTLNILNNKIKNRIVVHKDYEENLPKIEAYGGQINQVFMNILDNAQGAIKGTGDIFISAKKEGENIKIEFRDTGCGIKKENLNKIFEPFFTTKPVGQGTGLGMSIAYRVIEAHNGKISVESEQGVGTKVTILLPVNHKIEEQPKESGEV